MSTKKKIVFSIVLFGGVLLFTVAADRILGIAIRRSPTPDGLIFPPGSRYTYQTPEFTCEAITNSLGFRDREFDLNHKPQMRVLAIGDSFTFGWGVNVEQSWPKVLESSLRGKGYDVEVANLGEPGAAPDKYADIAERAVPMMKPQLIIVGITQGDDLAQLGQPPPQPAVAKKVSQSGFITRILWRLYPYSLSVIEGRRQLPPLREAWKADTKHLLDGLTAEEKARFEKLDPQVKQMLLDGELNPSLLQSALTHPDYLMKTIQLEQPETKALITKMAAQLGRIRRVAEANQARLLIVSVPYGAYVSEKDFNTRRRLGFILTAEVLQSNAPDDAIRKACDSQQLRFLTVTADIREVAKHTNIYYDLDGHFNALGYKTFAELLAPAVEKEFNQR